MKARVWFDEKRQMSYFDQVIEKGTNQFEGVLAGQSEANLWKLSEGDCLMYSTALFEKTAKKSGKLIYEGDIVKSRYIHERLNCGGLNTPENIGVVVFRQNEWQLKVKVGKNLAYLRDNYFYFSLDDPYSYRQVIGNELENDLDQLVEKHTTKM
ncbi:YopX family protein [Facklamia sp. P12950]|uniref:YopX family protein n=1 Tax=unclassified Facklamia TaxID=2622293 RepID=UPI003D186AAD